MIDHFTKKLWTKVIQSKSASVVVGFLEEVFLSVGLIEVDNITDSNDFITFLRSDNGTEFVAKDVKAVCAKFGIEKKRDLLIPHGYRVPLRESTKLSKIASSASSRNTRRWTGRVLSMLP